MTAIEQLWQRLDELPGDQREAMAAQVLEAWDALQWDVQQSRAGTEEAEKRDLQTGQADTNPRAERTSHSPSKPVPYERIEHLVGSIEGPGDLSTNPKYMEGFGGSARR